jgi:hypothetical protein
MAERPSGARLCETKPIARRAMGGTSALQKRTYGKSNRHQASAKQSQFFDCGLQIGGRAAAGANRAKRTQFGAAGRVGGRPQGCGARVKCAKRTQFGLGAGTDATKRVKRTQFAPGVRETPSGGDCAKQSQFPPEQREGQALCRKGVMVNPTCNRLSQNKANLSIADCGFRETCGRAAGDARLCETKPISRRRRAGRGPGGVGHGSNTQNEANFGVLASTWSIQCSTIPAFQFHANRAKRSQSWARCPCHEAPAVNVPPGAWAWHWDRRLGVGRDPPGRADRAVPSRLVSGRRPTPDSL